MNVMVTGSAGFIGSHFCENETRLSIYELDSNLRVNSACSSNPFLNNKLGNCDAVLHLAGLAHGNHSAQELNEVNHLGTLELASAAAKAGVKRFVFVSTVNVHSGATCNTPITEESSLDYLISPSKISAEEGLKKIGSETNMEITIVRPVLVYGKGAPGNMGLLYGMVSRLPFTLFGLINNKKSFISVGNLCDFLYVCCTHPKAGNEVFLISDNKSVSISVFMSAIAVGLDRKICHLPVSNSILRILGNLIGRSKQVVQLLDNLEVDISKAKNLLDWLPPETLGQAMGKIK